MTRMERPLRLLQLAPFPVLPASTGGKIRIIQLARALCSLGVEVTIVAPYHPTQRTSLAVPEPFSLLQVPYPFLLQFLLTDRPFPYGMLVSFHPGYRAMLPVSPASFDLCQLEHPAFADLLDAVPASTRVVYDAQNVEFDYVRSESEHGWIRRLAGERLRRLEARLLERSDHVFACSERDSHRFVGLYGVSADKLSVLPNGVTLDDRADRRKLRPPPRLPAGCSRRALFMGSAVAHNRKAVDALLTRVAPALAGAVQLVILGACARRLRHAARPNVHLDPDGTILDYAGPGVVGLNPVEQGSGTSLKVLDYLAHGLPVLSTPFGRRGFDDLAPWVATAEISRFPELLRKGLTFAAGAREALAPYEWRHVAARALQVYRKITASVSGPGENRRG